MKFNAYLFSELLQIVLRILIYLLRIYNLIETVIMTVILHYQIITSGRDIDAQTGCQNRFQNSLSEAEVGTNQAAIYNKNRIRIMSRT